jgi:pSer/pThr/pTyr-binding forkhead associated (FHA) protein
MMKILLKFKDAVIKEMPIEQDSYTIGRKEDNDIQIDNLAVSGFHAKLVKEGNTLYIEDKESTNGTFLNGRKITKSILQNGDVVLIGSHTIEYKTDIKSQEDATKTGVRSRSMNETILLSPTEQQKILASSEKLDVLGGMMIIEGTTDNKEYLLKERIATIGKDNSALIRLKGFFAPKVAALINRRKDGYFITPSGGKEMKINGNKVDKRYDLKDGDIVEVAGIKMQFFIKES